MYPKNYYLKYVFLFPTLLLFSLFILWPVIGSVYYSFWEWNGFSSEKFYVGWDNYTELVLDDHFWKAFFNTIIFVLITVPIRVMSALVLALLLNDPRLKLASLFRTALFLPVITTMSIMGIVMQMIFDPSGGPVNEFLLSLGLIDKPINFLGHPDTALYTGMGIHVWKWFGITMIYWLAALQTIPQDVLEAALIDGATKSQRFFYITLPMLRLFLAIITFVTAIDTLRVFDLILTLTGGGPFLSTEVIEVYIYRWAFNASIPELGYASAAAVFFGGLIIVFASLNAVPFLMKKRWESQ